MRNSPSETTIGGVFFVFRFERNHAVFFEEAFQRRFAVDQRADDLAVFRRALLLHDHPVAVHDTGADHAVAFDLQRKRSPLPMSSGIVIIPFDIFFAEKRFAGGHLAQDRHIAGGG